MKVYILEYDDGNEYEQNGTYIIGVYDDLDKAIEYAISCGFVPTEDDKTYLIRRHEKVIGKSLEFEDYARIYPFELNVSEEHKDIFEHHYKI